MSEGHWIAQMGDTSLVNAGGLGRLIDRGVATFLPDALPHSYFYSGDGQGKFHCLVCMVHDPKGPSSMCCQATTMPSQDGSVRHHSTPCKPHIFRPIGARR